AAEARGSALVDESDALPALTWLVELALLADLPAVVRAGIARLEQQASLAADLAHLADALPPLVNVLRYGNVRSTDTGAVAHVVDGLLARVCLGLPAAASGLDDAAAQALRGRVARVHAAVALLSEDDRTAWLDALGRQLAQRGVHG